MPCNVFTETKTLTVHGKRSSSSEMLSAFSSQKCLLSQKEWQVPQVCILPASIPEQGPPAWFYCSLGDECSCFYDNLTTASLFQKVVGTGGVLLCTTCQAHAPRSYKSLFRFLRRKK